MVRKNPVERWDLCASLLWFSWLEQRLRSFPPAIESPLLQVMPQLCLQRVEVSWRSSPTRNWRYHHWCFTGIAECLLPDQMVLTSMHSSQDDSFDISAMRNGRDLAGANVEDYFPFDTVPSSKAAIKSWPIEHGTPRMPCIPRPTPPSQPKHGSSLSAALLRLSLIRSVGVLLITKFLVL